LPAVEIDDPNLDWMFVPTPWLPEDSAWTGHIPFAHWLVARMRPAIVVEPGTHSGASYSAFCEAALKTSPFSRCFAVDTWLGDQHAGRYPEEIYAALAAFNAQRYRRFSVLLRKTFNAAVADFADGSVDLLHIDGLHTYDAVVEDFTTWRPKLSARAVVLFHDTNERHADFGVWRFWAELRRSSPGFEFLHSHGLGVLQYGSDAVPAVARLCALDAAGIEKLRHRFQFLGEQVVLRSRLLATRSREAEEPPGGASPDPLTKGR
jgi:hypothetical protein